MRLLDWRDPAVPSLASIWHEQARRWSDRLGWDSAENWALIEQQRQAGQLPGLVLLDGAGDIAGWTFFLVHGGTLQVGGLEARSEAHTHALLDAVTTIAEPGLAPGGVMLFAFSGAPAIHALLDAHGFETVRYRYLVRQAAANAVTMPAAAGHLQWQPGGAAALPSLLRRAYGPATLTRPFARADTDEEWADYLARLIGGGACGRFDPTLSACWTSPGGETGAVVLTTRIAARTAHIAQIAVDPTHRGGGIGEAMLADVIARAVVQGMIQVSLLVSDMNAPAQRLYARLGFMERASFVSAGRRA